MDGLTTLAIRVDDGLGNEQEEMHTLADWGGVQPVIPLTLQSERDDAIYRVTLELLDARGVIRVRARATGSFTPGELVVRRVRFDEACVDRPTPCQANRTCRDSECVSACTMLDEDLCAQCVAIDVRDRDSATGFLEPEDRSAADAGGDTTCAVAEGSLYCWGANASGQAGQEGLAVVSSPRRVGSFVDYVSVSVGRNHTCALRQEGELVCFGDNTHGQLGFGDRLGHGIDEMVPGRFDAISAGGELSCALSEDILYCWGESAWLGRGLASALPCMDSSAPCAPGEVARDFRWRQVATGRQHACAIRSNGQVFCWGSGAGGQLGNNGRMDAGEPDRVVRSGTDHILASTISVQGDAACAIGPEQARCWGKNEEGADLAVLPCGRTESTRACIARLEEDVDVFGVSVGGDEGLSSFCFLAETGVHCLGANRSRQISSEEEAVVLPPGAIRNDLNEVLESNGGEVSSMLSGRTHACVVTTLGELYCYGANNSGQLGLGTSNDEPHEPSPVCIPGTP